jgi:cysteine-rich CPCC protein
MNNLDRDEVIKLIAKCRLTFGTDQQIEELLEYSLNDVSDLQKEVYDELSELYSGVNNGYLSSIYEELTGEKVEVVGEIIELFTCPCCKLKTLFEKYDVAKGTGYEICDYCGWEDDGTSDANSQSSVNRGSINEYRGRIQTNQNYYSKGKYSE